MHTIDELTESNVSIALDEILDHSLIDLEINSLINWAPKAGYRWEIYVEWDKKGRKKDRGKKKKDGKIRIFCGIVVAPKRIKFV